MKSTQILKLIPANNVLPQTLNTSTGVFKLVLNEYPIGIYSNNRNEHIILKDSIVIAEFIGSTESRIGWNKKVKDL